MAKVSGHLLDRINLHVDVPAVRYKELASKKSSQRSQVIRRRVVHARKIRMVRFDGKKGMYCPPRRTDMQSKGIQTFCKLGPEGVELLKMAITKLGLSARAYDRILKVARTIADLAAAPSIRPEDISEAIQYRSLDRNLWKSQR